MPFSDPEAVTPKPRRKPHQQYHLADGTRVPSVTQVLQVINKPALIGWANKMGLQGIDSNAFRDEKADIGTTAHAMAEGWFKGIVPDIEEELRQAAMPGYRNFLRWANEHRIHVVEAEQQLVSEKFGYGGTIDLLCYIDTYREVIDLKFTKSIHHDQFYQLVAYAALAEEHGHLIEAVRIVRCEREPDSRGTPFEEQRLTRGELKPYWEVFKAALALWRAQQAFVKGDLYSLKVTEV